MAGRTGGRRPAAARAKTRTLAHRPERGPIRRTVLPSGLRILTEQVPAMRSVAFGVWVRVGSRDEAARLSGVSHFLEHLLFKGTRRRSALDISAAIEEVGGETNAFTAKEYTCFYARVLDTHLPLAVDVVCDLVTGSVLAAPEVETERRVILAEIAMQDDEPGELVHDRFAWLLYGGHPLGRRISGSADSIGALTRRQIQGFYQRRYTAPSIVVAAAGSLDHGSAVRLVREAVAGTPLGEGSADPAPVRGGEAAPPRPRAPGTLVDSKDTEQAHLLVGCPAIGRDDERRFALDVLNNVLGGGMSSRLFQQIREERGLAYATYSYAARFAGTGLFAVYAGCAPGKVAEVLDLVRAELARAARHGITEAELVRGKGMLAGSMVLGLEDTGSRMGRLAKGELLYQRPRSDDELLARIDRVSRAEVNDLAAELLASSMSVAAVGPLHAGDLPAG
jgi:predicted Zn-dependent peptidase